MFARVVDEPEGDVFLPDVNRPGLPELVCVERVVGQRVVLRVGRGLGNCDSAGEVGTVTGRALKVHEKSEALVGSAARAVT